jgi:hypothetical protein
MKKYTKNKMIEFAQSLPPSSDRAKCYEIANLRVKTTIAEAISQAHRSADGPQQMAALMVRAGCAREVGAHDHFYGTFVFEDKSTL